jgi:hypothetical protein
VVSALVYRLLTNSGSGRSSGHDELLVRARPGTRNLHRFIFRPHDSWLRPHPP